MKGTIVTARHDDAYLLQIPREKIQPAQADAHLEPGMCWSLLHKLLAILSPKPHVADPLSKDTHFNMSEILATNLVSPSKRS